MTNFSFGNKSKKKLATCHPLLEEVAYTALAMSPYDFTIIHGFRGQAVQTALFDSNASTLDWPDSKHNATGDNGEYCSEAIDFAPWIYSSIDWNDKLIFSFIAGVFHAAAAEHDVRLRWGGDWDMDGSSRDQKFMDIGHIEILL